MCKSLRAAAAIVGVMLGVCRVFAHDFWLEPSSFTPEPGTTITLRLRVGEDFIGDALPRDPALLEQFIAPGRSGVAPVPGRTGRDPAGASRIGQPGLVVIGYQSRHSSVEMTSDAFSAYLAKEGLDRIAGMRATRKHAVGTTRDLFSRCAKVLVLAGPAGVSGHDRVLGFNLELVSDRDPYTMRAGEDLPVRLLYQGQPLEGALVVAMNRSDPATKVRARSGRDGRVSLRLSRDGAWLVKAVHMIPSSSGADAEWESFWASLTFEIPQAATSMR